jgi:uncharacterized protein (DUF433 family)
METALDRHIEATPGMRGGKPRLSGTRITVADVVLMHLRLGQALEEIAGQYDLSLAALYAAMAYYYDHQREVDGSIDDDVAFAEAFRRNNPSPLQEKLKAFSRG